MRREEISHNETNQHENLDYEHTKINMELSTKSNLDFPVYHSVYRPYYIFLCVYPEDPQKKKKKKE